MKGITFPAWFTGPDGKSAIFEAAADVPKGWTSGAEKQTVDGSAASAPKPKLEPSTPAPPAKTSGKEEVDAHGHQFDPEMHAATRSKTKDGLWRMKVGVRRPDPVPGYPLDL